jgi:hypothetical protein
MWHVGVAAITLLSLLLLTWSGGATRDFIMAVMMFASRPSAGRELQSVHVVSLYQIGVSRRDCCRRRRDSEREQGRILVSPRRRPLKRDELKTSWCCNRRTVGMLAS